MPTSHRLAQVLWVVGAAYERAPSPPPLQQPGPPRSPSPARLLQWGFFAGWQFSLPGRRLSDPWVRELY